MKKNRIIIIFLGIVLIVGYQITKSISESMGNLTVELREDNELVVSLNALAKQTEKKGHSLVFFKKLKKGPSKSSETTTAQQIERFLGYNKGNEIILTNIADNMVYYKNPVSVLFYLSYAYMELADYEKALNYLDDILQNYDATYTFLYMFGAQRLASKVYYVPVISEIYLRKAEIFYLNGNKKAAIAQLDKLLALSQSTYGYGEITFFYSELAVKNIKAIPANFKFARSIDRYYSAAMAKQLVNRIMLSEDKLIIGEYISTKYGATIFGTALASKKDFLNVTANFKINFKTMPTKNISIALESYGKKGEYNLYTLTANGYGFEIINIGNDQYLSRLNK